MNLDIRRRMTRQVIVSYPWLVSESCVRARDLLLEIALLEKPDGHGCGHHQDRDAAHGYETSAVFRCGDLLPDYEWQPPKTRSTLVRV